VPLTVAPLAGEDKTGAEGMVTDAVPLVKVMAGAPELHPALFPAATDHL